MSDPAGRAGKDAAPDGDGQPVRYSVAGGVATLTMDQPHNRNALTPALLSGLAAGLDAALADDGARVIVLTHAGPAFCAGADLSAGRNAASAARPGLADVLAGIQDAPKPVLARIAGHCLGGGVGLAAACDLSVAADTAWFGFTEVRVGVAPAPSAPSVPQWTDQPPQTAPVTAIRITPSQRAPGSSNWMGT